MNKYYIFNSKSVSIIGPLSLDDALNMQLEYIGSGINNMILEPVSVWVKNEEGE